MTIDTATRPTDAIRGRSLAVLLVMCGAIFLEGIDVGMFNVALPSIRAELPMGTGELQWIISAYILGYGGFMLVGGRAADLFGRRRVFLIALTAFLLFSGLGALATDGWLLILARGVTGVAAAFMAPAGLSIITTSFEGRARDRAVLIYSGVGAGGFTIGLVAGGLLTLLGWRWVFIAPLLVAAVLLALSIRYIPRSADERVGRGTLDLFGGLTVTAALVLLVAGIEGAAHQPLGVTVATIGAGLVLLGVFVVIERRSRHPLVRLGIFRNPGLVRANLSAAMLAGGFLGFQFLVVLFLQEELGWSVLETSLAMLVMGLDVIVAPLVTPKLVARFGHRRVAFGGLVFALIAYALFLPVAPDWTYAMMLPSFLAIGLAFSFAYGPLTIGATEGIDEAEQGLAGGLLYSSFEFGGAIGLAAVSAVLVALAEGGMSGVEVYRGAVIVPLVVAAIAVLVAAIGVRRDYPRAARA
ncbi:MFS transporter [Agromyces subbeticus]|uniref:MFS transporter n=1 Tax=Agromyces subbeticus TaxID=293890 RepID=UPI0003B57C37|nr:MFS transporter [Agromyces subbeticus]